MQFIRRDLVPHNLIHDDLGDMRVTHDAARDEELTASIKELGIRDPITLRPHPKIDGEYQLIDGRRRRRCNEVAGSLEIPAEIYQMTDIEALLTALAKNIQRDEPDPVGLGFWLEEIKKKDPSIKTQEDLAKAVHRSQTWVSRMLSAYNLALESFKNEKQVDGRGLSIEDLQNSMPTERHARILKQASEEVKERVIDLTSILGMPPSARSIERMVKAKVTVQEVLGRYGDPKSDIYEDDFVIYQLVENAGVTATEAAKIVNDWRHFKLSWQKTMKPLMELGPGDKTVEMYRKLSEIYPTELIDWVDSVAPAKTFETMSKYCRRLIRSLILKTPDELKQTVLENFRGG